MKKKMLLLFLGLAVTVGGLSANDEKERTWNAKVEQVRTMLLENGASEDIVADVLRDMAERHERQTIEDRNSENDPWSESLGSEGASNTFYGYLAGSGITTGIGNSFFGRTAGKCNNSGAANTILGHKAGFNTTSGFDNTFVGYMSGYKNIAGAFNTFIGKTAGYSTTDGIRNTFVGYEAGYANTTAWSNTFIGYAAGTSNSTGWYNTYIGSHAGQKNSSGSNNVFIGAFAGYNNTGAGNVFIGDYAGQNATGNSKLYIENSDAYSVPLIYGDFTSRRVGINNSTPGYTFVVGTGGAYCNGSTWVNGSSRDFKENIEALAPEEALLAFAELEPVKFNYKEDKEEKCLGFIAEDVPDLVAMKDRKSLSPMDIVAVLTKVVQEQLQLNLEQQKELSVLRARLSNLEKKLSGESQD
jgi:hypothetical protein